MSKKPLFFYGWVVLALSFVAMVLAHGARNSFSAFYVVILDEFGWTRASTAGIFSVNLIPYGVAAPLTGSLVDKFGPKRVLLSGTAVLALAIMLCSTARTIYDFYLLFGLAGAIGVSLIAYPVSAPVLGFGLGGTVGPWLGGFVFDRTKTYSGAVITSILLVCAALVLLWIAAPRRIQKIG